MGGCTRRGLALLSWGRGRGEIGSIGVELGGEEKKKGGVIDNKRRGNKQYWDFPLMLRLSVVYWKM